MSLPIISFTKRKTKREKVKIVSVRERERERVSYKTGYAYYKMENISCVTFKGPLESIP